MKKLLTALSISILALSVGGAASAADVAFTGIEPNRVITPQDSEQTVFLNQDWAIPNGSSWQLLSGDYYISLSGNVVHGKRVGGPAKVRAFKSNGDLLGVYTINVVKK
ncbi:hypothetical protein [Paenibacillus peoriae]|uniref:hypothetical protein n=1 Tax=Paenibacillus peoriae TaxID=59893 RepID=UPI00096FD6C9|nr:hypothetical protein [Paenibacillus peoriae]OMF42903.1 hypothetical protein BK135_18655 [Paenibacillus peoriae]